jgi:hypothetical protein
MLIEGQNLRRIEIAMQKGELAFVAKLPTNYRLWSIEASR